MPEINQFEAALAEKEANNEANQSVSQEVDNVDNELRDATPGATPGATPDAVLDATQTSMPNGAAPVAAEVTPAAKPVTGATEVEAAKEGLSWGKVALLGLVVALILGGMGGFVYWRNWTWRWEKIVMPETMARVPTAWPVEKLAARLQETEKVRDAQAFLEAAREAKLQTVEPGGYLLPKEAGPRELAQLFAGGPQLLKITFPEGWTASQMARRLDQNGFAAGEGLRPLAYPPGRISPLEGRLFPDTYYLSPQASAKEVAGQLQEQFLKVTNELPRPFPPVKGKPLSLSQVVVLASLVERETNVPDERPLIAGVLLNRLNKGMRLQCDASVQYARQRAMESGQLPQGDGHKARLLFRDLTINSPYNTYQHAGLPPGPICNPGADALKAAARPEKSPYFFYVMSPKLGRHRFAKTFEEHTRNIALARQER